MNGTTLKQWLTIIVEHTNSIGLQVVAFSADGGKGNMAVMKELYASKDPQAVISAGDYSHMVKNILNPLRYAEDGRFCYRAAPGPLFCIIFYLDIYLDWFVYLFF